MKYAFIQRHRLVWPIRVQRNSVEGPPQQRNWQRVGTLSGATGGFT
jgi:hypothetical protein